MSDDSINGAYAEHRPRAKIEVTWPTPYFDREDSRDDRLKLNSAISTMTWHVNLVVALSAMGYR